MVWSMLSVKLIISASRLSAHGPYVEEARRCWLSNIQPHDSVSHCFLEDTEGEVTGGWRYGAVHRLKWLVLLEELTII